MLAEASIVSSSAGSRRDSEGIPAITGALFDYFRCPDSVVHVELSGELSDDTGFFDFGDDITCYGRPVGCRPAQIVEERRPTVDRAGVDGDRLLWPFDLSEVVDNLRRERYVAPIHGSFGRMFADLSRRVYYQLRPILSIPVRKRLQRIRLRGWRDIEFPRWPVDVTVENLMRSALASALRAGRIDAIPFIWFWPDGAPCCAMMTHDVESAAGLAFCDRLMDIDDLFGIKSAFQIVPERYQVGEHRLAQIRRRGFEVNVHDLNHDGFLFHDKQEFLRRAARINGYIHQFHSCGFRSGAMYRNQEWYEAFDFQYDMSVPNVAHFEPQRGGCSTVMPHFIGRILELPLTTTQDYSLFHILDDYSIDLWKRQIDIIRDNHGLASFIAHPDYLEEPRATAVYTDLLAHLSRLRSAGQLWVALPAEINRWWRNRHHMRLVPDGAGWRIEGPDSHRARIAYASLDGNQLVYAFDSASRSTIPHERT